MRKLCLVGLTVLCLVVFAFPAFAQSILFDNPYDTISIAGNSILSNSVTIECRIMWLPDSQGGRIYNEWYCGFEDKALSAGTSPGQFNEYLFPIDNWTCIQSTAPATVGVWHHIAFVYDGSQERLYLDGQKVADRAMSGNIWNASNQSCAMGALYRDDAISKSFTGMLDTFRISTVARYSENFIAPQGDLTTDAYTNLLYNFDEPVGATMVHDLSGNGRNGTFGVGFTGATSPEIVVPEPSSIVIIMSGLIPLTELRRRN